MSTTASAPLPASKEAYSFDDTTREYVGVVEIFLSPLEGRYFLPRNVVEIAPPSDLGANQRARLNADETAWDVVPDFRRCMLWDKATCRPMPNTLALGDTPPDSATAEAPPVISDQTPVMHVWDENTHAWLQLPDYSRTPVWIKATAMRTPSPAPREPLSDTLTVIQPPSGGDHQAPQWNAQHDRWDIVPDYRGVTYWTADGAQHVITELGIAPPADALASPPVDPAPDDSATTPAPITDEA
jgi:hypothetical protein